MTPRRSPLHLALAGAITIGLAAGCAGADGPEGQSPESPAVTTTATSATSATTATALPSGAEASASGSAGSPQPVRTVTPDAPAKQVMPLSSADLDVLLALELEPTAAWAVDGTGPRPWRQHPAPAGPEWDEAGMPSLRSLLPFGAEAFAMAAADVSESQLRAYEGLAAVIVDPEGRPGWRDHLNLMADAVGRDPDSAAASTEDDLEAWAEKQRRLGVEDFVVVVGTGAHPDTPVATLASNSPPGAEIRELGFGVISHPEPVAYRDLRRPGVQVVRVDPRDEDLVAAVRQPSVSSLPWALDRLVTGRRPA